MLFFFWFLCALGAGIVASSKGRSGFGWFLLSLLLFGILGLLIVGLMPSLNKPAAVALSDDRERFACPACRELILKGAEVCRFCGTNLKPVAPVTASVARITCKNCGRTYPPGQKVCSCGMTLR